ncbi:hypothetical protein [Xylanimonas sp. McL0601]|uniref:hypothetical protein n=1 Tax=Xylanimonas sp. McL0601 TaxID=3414739 RepID=UPI003CF03B57
MSERSPELLSLVETVELNEVGFNEISAKRAPLPDANPETADVQPSYGLSIEHTEDQFRVAVRVDVATVVGPVAVEAFAHYKALEGVPELTQALLVDYTNEVVLMVLLPYLRQAIADVTQRIFGTPLLMPVLPRGAITFGSQDTAEEQ